MGLDMFLNGINFEKQEVDSNFNVIKKRKVISTLEIHWRKANAIHRYFVENIQFNYDDCREYELETSTLIKLRNKCQAILNSNNRVKRASEILPTMDGMFFGSTQYDREYFETLEYTVKELNRLIDCADSYDWFTYQSSW